MRNLSEFLTEREIYILEEGQKRTLKDLSLMMGLTSSRISGIRQQAEGKIRQEKLREQAHPDNQEPVTVTLQKKDLYVIDRALTEYISIMNKKHIAPLFPNDPLGDVDYEASKKLQIVLNNYKK